MVVYTVVRFPLRVLCRLGATQPLGPISAGLTDGQERTLRSESTSQADGGG